MTNAHLYEDANLAQFYDLENAWGADFDTCIDMAAEAENLLDLGCGTGALVAHLAPSMPATGVDPAAAMIDIAKQRNGGQHATWVVGDARSLDLEQQFDLIVLTGNTFQVFLTEADQRAALATIARHLSPRGKFIFDTRNPDCAAWEKWAPEQSHRTVTHDKYGEIEVFNDAEYEAQSAIVTYETTYKIHTSGQSFTAKAQMKFTPLAELKSLISDAGLHVETWFGTWDGAALSNSSQGFIPLGRRA
ncbi:MAG: methyltransferase domain-containing protein [Rhodobacterales bacterium]|nr:methyltransferase domain-containing protein [Rhodobacterales bacterium]